MNRVTWSQEQDFFHKKDLVLKIILVIFPFCNLYAILGINPLDELIILSALILILFQGGAIKLPKIHLLEIILIILIFACFTGLLWDIKGLRVIPLLIIYFFIFQNITRLLEFKKYLLIGLYISLFFQISLSGVSANTGATFYEEDWEWQSSVWAGTATAAYVFLVSYVFLLLETKNKNYEISGLSFTFLSIILLLTAIGMDSRMMLYVLAIIIPLNIIKIFFGGIRVKNKDLRISFFSIFISVSFFLGVFFVLVNFFAASESFGPSLVSVDQASSAAEAIEEVDRIYFLIQTYQYVITDPISALFPKGIYSHQYLLSSFIDYGGSTGGKVRPTGLPAFIVDFGLIACFLFLIWGVRIFFVICISKISIMNKLVLSAMLGLIPFSLVIVNLQETAIFFFSIYILEALYRNNFELLR
tara:strand:- start:10003 stop:11250 length:1248 start_codon:yes stop_codon:yes gene_type:complete